MFIHAHNAPGVMNVRTSRDMDIKLHVGVGVTVAVAVKLELSTRHC
jgi:hypothetical protein